MPLDLTPQSPPYYTIEDTNPATNLINGTEYIQNLTQASTAAPTGTVIKDTITGITVARTGVGQYTFTKTGAFTLTNTMWLLNNTTNGPTEGYMKLVWTNNNVLTLFTFNTSGVVADDVLVNTTIYIRKTT